MNSSIAHMISAMHKNAAPAPVPAAAPGGGFLPLAGAGLGYMAGGDSLLEKAVPAGLGYYLGNMYNNMTPEQKSALWGKNPELAQQAAQHATQQAAAAAPSTIPAIAPGAAGAPDVHANIRPAGIPAGSTLHHVETPAVPGGAPAQKHMVWSVTGANGIPVLHDSNGVLIDKGSPLYHQARTQINSGQAPAQYAALPQATNKIPTGNAQNIFRTSAGENIEVVHKPATATSVDPATGRKIRGHAASTELHYVDDNGGRIGKVTDPKEFTRIDKEFKSTQPAAPAPGPRIAPPKGFIETSRGEFFNPKTQKALVFDPVQGLKPLAAGPEFDRIRNAGMGVPAGAQRVPNPFMPGKEVVAVPNPNATTPAVPGVSGGKVNSYSFYEYDPKSGMGPRITNDKATQTLHNSLLGEDYSKTQTQNLVSSYRNLEAAKPTPADYIAANNKDSNAINKIREYNQKLQNLRAQDAQVSKVAPTPQNLTSKQRIARTGTAAAGGALAGAGIGRYFGSMFDDENESMGANIGTAVGGMGGLAAGGYFGKKLSQGSSITKPLQTVESRMKLGNRLAGGAGAVAGAVPGLILGTEGGRALGGMLGGKEGEEWGAGLGGITGALGTGYFGKKLGNKFFGNTLGDSLGEVGRGSALNAAGEKIDSSLLKRTKLPLGRAALGLGAAGIGAYLLHDWLSGGKKKALKPLTDVVDTAKDTVWNSGSGATRFDEPGIKWPLQTANSGSSDRYARNA